MITRIIILSALLVGCGSHMQNTSIKHEVSCNNDLGWDGCYDKAVKLCDGYTIADHTEDHAGYSDQYGYHPVLVKRKLMIVCN
jgi:hypothetical protein